MAQTKTAPAPATKRAPRTLAGTLPAHDHARAQIVAQYEAALRLMQEGKYDKAHAAFEKMLAGAGRLKTGGKPILELNAHHDLVRALAALGDDDRAFKQERIASDLSC